MLIEFSSTTHARRRAVWLATLVMLGVSGCAAITKSTPPPDAPGQDSGTTARISIAHSLPAILPKNAIPFPHGQYLFVPASSAAGLAASMVVPIPFVTDFALAQMNKTRAEHYKDAYIGIDPYQLTLAAARGNTLFTDGNAPASLHPFVVVQECADDAYRLTLIMQVVQGKWMGRYLYHLPTPIPKQDFPKPSAAELTTFQSELQAGAGTLVKLIERDARGDLAGTQTRVEFGSLFIVGGRVSGLVSPTAVLVRNAQLIEETDDHVILRSDGTPKAEVQQLGLQFGVHYFAKNQLHTFKKL